MPTELSSRSEEMQDLLSRSPSSLLRWGMFLLCVLMGILFAGTAFVRYPEKVNVAVVFTGSPRVLRMYAPLSGQLGRYFVQNGQEIREGEPLLVMKNAADVSAVLELEKALFNRAGLETFEKFLALPLGSLQTEFASYYQNVQKLAQHKAAQNFRTQAAEMLQKQANQVNTYTQGLAAEQPFLLQEKTLLETEQALTRKLAKEGLIAKRDTEKTNIALLQKELELKRHENAKIQQQAQLLGYEKEFQGLQKTAFELEQALTNEIQASHTRLFAQIAQWKQQYMLFAPASGKVVIFDAETEKQYVKADSELLCIVPALQHFELKAVLPAKEISRIKVGQKANIKMENYDYQRFGMLEASISGISLIPQSQNYQISLTLTNGLTTTYHQTLPFYVDMKGSAEIVTENRVLLAYSFEPLRKVLF